MDLDEALKRATAELEEAEAQFRAVQARVRELETIRDGLRFALARYAKRPPRDRDQPAAREDEQQAEASAASAAAELIGSAREDAPLAAGVEAISQTEVSYNMLGKLGGRAATHEVREKAIESGYVYTQEQIRSALQYLMRKGRIRRVSPGMWEIPA